MRNVVHWATLIFVTLMIGCSSEDSETPKVESSNQTQLSAKKPVERRHTATLNGAPISSTGDPNYEDVELYLINAGIPQGAQKMDGYMRMAVVTSGNMSTNDQSDIALSQCLATSGLKALDMLLASLGGQEIRSRLTKNNVETQPTDSLMMDGGTALTFNTDDGSVRYKIQSRLESVTPTTPIPDLNKNKILTKAIQVSDDSGAVCAYESSSDEDGRQQSWDCDIQAVNKLFRHNQKGSTQNVTAVWLGSELDGSQCYSAFVFKIPQ